MEENELLALNNLVEQYLVFAEGQAMRRIPMYMKDWIDKLNGFPLNDRAILEYVGKISHELAVEHSEKEYTLFQQKRIQEDITKDSDFVELFKIFLGKKNLNSVRYDKLNKSHETIPMDLTFSYILKLCGDPSKNSHPL